eukprot:6631018-Pyramimonas_sp.AAC.1
MPIPKLRFNTWRSPHIIRLGLHHCGTALFATFGLPAGCDCADVAARAFTITEYDQLVRRNPSVDFMSYIDGTEKHVSGRDRDVVPGGAVQAGVQFQAVSRRLQATLNNEVAAVASASSLGIDVATNIGLAKDKSKPAVTHLGTDFNCGRRRGQARTVGMSKSRLRKSAQRLAKAAKLK